jgi:hypothetical protein
MSLRLLKRNWAAVAQPIDTYFVQDQVSDTEGPHAQEVSRREFADWASANLDAPIEYDAGMAALFLRLDVLTAQGVVIGVPA